MVPQTRAVNFILIKAVAWYTAIASLVLLFVLLWSHHQFEQKQQRSASTLYTLIESSLNHSRSVPADGLWWLRLDLDSSENLAELIAAVTLSSAKEGVVFNWQGDKTVSDIVRHYEWRTSNDEVYSLRIVLANAGMSSYFFSEVGILVMVLVVQLILLLLVLSVQIYRGMRSAFNGFMRELSLVNLKHPSPLQPDAGFSQFLEYRQILSAINRVILSLAKSREELSEMNAELEQRIQVKTAALEEKNDELVALNQQLSVIANTDALTQVYNRTRFDILFGEHVTLAKRRHTALSILLIDLDDFKKVNDEYGHQVGDHVLKHAALVVSEVIGEDGIVARWGGEEFAVLLPYVDLEVAETRAEEVRDAIAKAQFEEQHIHVTTSIGVAELANEETGSQLLKRADDALYDAKGCGRNRVIVAYHHSVSRQLEIESLAKNELIEELDAASEPTLNELEVSVKPQS